MDILAAVFKQTSWQLLGKAISSTATIIALGVISRTYGPAGTGVITLALTFLTFFALAVDFGANAYVLPHLLKADFKREWQNLFGFRLILASLLTLLALFLTPFISADFNFSRIIYVGAFFAIFEAAIFISTNAIFQAKLRYDLSTLAYSVGALTELGLIVFLILNHTPLAGLVLAYAGGWLVISILATILVQKYIPFPIPIFSLSYIKSILSGVWPISLTLVLNTLYFRLDAFILSFFYSFTEVGIYNVAYLVFQSALVVPAFIMNAFFPIMIKNLNENRGQFKKLLGRAIIILSLISFLGTILTLLLSPLVITLITGGRGFSQSATALQILSLGFPAYFLSSLGMWVLVTLKKYKTVLLIYIAGLLVNAGLNWLFIPSFSFYAASYITGISEYLILILQAVILFKEFYGTNR